MELSCAMYGEPLGAMEGVLHIVAVAEREGGGEVLKIGPHAPTSAWDLFVLGFARARVEAILVTGAVLRAEPALRYELAPGLRAYRETVAGLREPPLLCVLTGGEIDLAHPALAGWARPVVLTTPSAAARLRGGAVEVAAIERPSARAAIDYLMRERGCRSVSIEAGPRTASPLYAPPAAIDELARSVYEGPLDPRARAGALPAPSHLTLVSSARPDPSQPWRFERWVRPGGLTRARRGTAGGSG